MNHEETENLNRPRTSNNIESIINKCPPNKSPDPDGFIGEFYQIFKKQLVFNILKLFYKTEEEGKLLN